MKHPVSVILKSKGNKVTSVTPTDSVANAIHEMNEANIGAVVVIEHNKVVGMFTERDVLRKACFRSLDDMKHTTIRDMMSEDLITGTPETTVEEAMRIFTEKRFRHLPIIKDDQLVGIISSGDVTKWIMDQQQSEIDHLSDYIAGDHQALKPNQDD